MPDMNREEIAKLEALYASNPEGRVFTHLAEAYRKAGNYDRARRILEQGLTRHPGYASAYVVLGRVFLDLDQGSEAESSFRKVLELDPHNLVALRSLGDIARAAGRTDESLGYFEELRHQDPSNAEIEGVLAELRQAVTARAEAAATAEEPAATAEEPALEEPPAPDVVGQAAEEAPAAEEELPISRFEEPVYQQAEPEPIAPPVHEEIQLEQPAIDSEPDFGVPASLEGYGPVESDYDDLVSPDIELNWGNGDGAEPAEEPLPGDLANLASLGSAFDVRDENSPVEEEPPPPEAVPSLDFPDVGEPTKPGEEEAPLQSDANTGVVTETMAQLYRDQGLYERSAEVFRALLKERPYDKNLQTSLAEVEALASIIGADQEGPEAAPIEMEEEISYDMEPLPFIPTAPEAIEQPSVEYLGIERDEDVESPWMSAQPATAETPNPYTWREEHPENDAGPPITQYFRDLLSWRPASVTARAEPEPEPEVANFLAPPEMEAQPAILDLGPMEITEPFEEPTLTLPEPPAIPADELMPWEEPASPSMPAAPISPPPAPGSGDPVEAAFEEWFTGREEPAKPASNAPQPAAPAEPSAASNQDSEDDDDLEMFRSWLQSLKK